MLARVTSVDQLIVHDEFGSTSGERLNSWPRIASTMISRPQICLRKSLFYRLKKTILLHRRVIQFLEIVHIKNLRVSVHQQQSVVVVGAQGIEHLRCIHSAVLLERGHNSHHAVGLLVQHATEAHSIGRSPCRRHLPDKTFGNARRICRLVARRMSIGDEVLRRLPHRRRPNFRARGGPGCPTLWDCKQQCPTAKKTYQQECRSSHVPVFLHQSWYPSIAHQYPCSFDEGQTVPVRDTTALITRRGLIAITWAGTAADPRQRRAEHRP